MTKEQKQLDKKIKDKREFVKNEILSKKSLLKKGRHWLSEKYDIDVDIVSEILYDLKDEAKKYRSQMPTRITGKKVVEKFYDKIKESNSVILPSTYPEAKVVTKKTKQDADPNNVLIIGDLHAPFILDGYLDFNIELQRKYNCGTIIFIGDIIDGHSWSFHEHNVDGLSVRNELDAAISQLKPWYKAFPNATILFGNHDLLISRKASAYGLSQVFLRHFGDIVEAPKTWNFVHELYLNNVLYIHGSQGNAIDRAKDMRYSLVQGHLHSQAFVQWSVSEIDSIFGLQIGCGIDRKAYAFEYAKDMPKKPIISSGIVLESGRLPIIELMAL